MQRDSRLYFQDILECIREIEEFMKNVTSKQDFIDYREKKRAIERNIEIIGGAVKKIPENLKTLKPEIEWKKIAGLRDILAHGYFSVDNEVL